MVRLVVFCLFLCEMVFNRFQDALHPSRWHACACMQHPHPRCSYFIVLSDWLLALCVYECWQGIASHRRLPESFPDLWVQLAILSHPTMKSRKVSCRTVGLLHLCKWKLVEHLGLSFRSWRCSWAWAQISIIDISSRSWIKCGYILFHACDCQAAQYGSWEENEGQQSLCLQDAKKGIIFAPLSFS